MSADWSTSPLGELAENVSRPFNFKGKEKVIFINTRDVLEGKFLHKKYSPVAGLPGQAKKAIQKGDILYSEIRPGNKRYAFVDFDAEEYVVSTKFMVVRANEEILPEFLYLILIGHACEQEFKIIAESRSGTFPQITFDSVSYYPVTYPNTQKKQQDFVEFAGSISGKIEFNHQINQTLEQIAQAIFKFWFMDFDPVKAKIVAKQNSQDPERAAMSAISGKTDDEIDQLPQNQHERLAATAALFPDELEESEKGKLPKGWVFKPLYETAEFINGAAFKSKDFSLKKEGLPIIKIVELKAGITDQTKFTIHDFPEKYSIDDDSMLYSWSGSPNTSLEVFKWFGGKGWLNQHIFKIVTDNEPQKLFVYYLLRQLKPTLIAIATDKQTTGLGHVTVADMKRLLVPFPNDEVLSCFGDIVGPLYEHASILEKQSGVLAGIRDALLPKLLSGELSVSQ